MIRVTDKSRCSGCSACYSACPHGAISMRPDALGFKYPVVDGIKCTDCGLCDKVCAFGRPFSELKQPVAKAARNIDEGSLMKSRSGAVFPALAEYVISAGGVVYGAAMDADFRVVHKRAATMQEADAFRGSKYSQSDMGDVFEAVKADLKEGLMVLFSGTPCQVHGLRSYVPEKLRGRLVLVDIVCHGVPSPYVWRDYLKYQEESSGGKISEVCFRDKNIYGWNSHKETYRVDGKLITDTSFTHLFAKDIMLRPSCNVCPYADVKRVSDITLGDFWGWQKAVPGFNDDNRGVSLVLISTAKGNDIFGQCGAELEIRDVRLCDCMQPNLQCPSKAHKDTEAFAADYESKGLLYVMKRYGDKGWRYRVYSTYMNIKTTIKGWLKR